MDEFDAGDIEWRELDELVHWPAERLIALGYKLGRAASLAISGIDIHQLKRLIENGCPSETAVRIAA